MKEVWVEREHHRIVVKTKKGDTPSTVVLEIQYADMDDNTKFQKIEIPHDMTYEIRKALDYISL